MDRVIIGLGNPGDKYKYTRHNIGAELIMGLNSYYGSGAWVDKFKSKMSNIKIAGLNILLAFPQTYMNNSGEAVRAIMDFYKLSSDKIFVVHDDLDLELARIKVKIDGGHGGHNGLRSIDSHIGKQYYRLRFGIGHPGDKNMVSNYVLANFAKSENEMLEIRKIQIINNIELLLQYNITEFLNNIG